MDYREIQRLAGDPAGVRRIAKVLLTVPGLTDRQIDFLSDMAEIKVRITTRQGETLIGIRDDLVDAEPPGAGHSWPGILVSLAVVLHLDVADLWIPPAASATNIVSELRFSTTPSTPGCIPVRHRVAFGEVVVSKLEEHRSRGVGVVACRLGNL
jgi:hypothetical protein